MLKVLPESALRSCMLWKQGVFVWFWYTLESESVSDTSLSLSQLVLGRTWFAAQRCTIYLIRCFPVNSVCTTLSRDLRVHSRLIFTLDQPCLLISIHSRHSLYFRAGSDAFRVSCMQARLRGSWWWGNHGMYKPLNVLINILHDIHLCLTCRSTLPRST